MNQITNISTNALQQQTIILDDGSTFTFTMYFVSLQAGWFITELTYGTTFTLRGLRITNSVNMLNQWRNLIPFGFACISTANREPSLLQDFATQASKLYVLTKAECEQYADILKAS